MPADRLTKRLLKGKYSAFIQALGMVNTKERVGLGLSGDQISEEDLDIEGL